MTTRHKNRSVSCEHITVGPPISFDLVTALLRDICSTFSVLATCLISIVNTNGTCELQSCAHDNKEHEQFVTFFFIVNSHRNEQRFDL